MFEVNVDGRGIRELGTVPQETTALAAPMASSGNEVIWSQQIVEAGVARRILAIKNYDAQTPRVDIPLPTGFTLSGVALTPEVAYYSGTVGPNSSAATAGGLYMFNRATSATTQLFSCIGTGEISNALCIVDLSVSNNRFLWVDSQNKVWAFDPAISASPRLLLDRSTDIRYASPRLSDSNVYLLRKAGGRETLLRGSYLGGAFTPVAPFDIANTNLSTFYTLLTTPVAGRIGVVGRASTSSPARVFLLDTISGIAEDFGTVPSAVAVALSTNSLGFLAADNQKLKIYRYSLITKVKSAVMTSSPGCNPSAIIAI